MSSQSWCHGSESLLDQSHQAWRSAWCRGRCWLVSGPDEEPWLCRRSACDTPSGLMWAAPWLAGWTAPPNNACHVNTLATSANFEKRSACWQPSCDLPFFNAPTDETGQVPAFAMLHDNVERGVGAVYDAVVVPHFVWMLEFPQEVHLRHQHLLLTLCHGAVVQLLPHKDLQNRRARIKQRF